MRLRTTAAASLTETFLTLKIFTSAAPPVRFDGLGFGGDQRSSLYDTGFDTTRPILDILEKGALEQRPALLTQLGSFTFVPFTKKARSRARSCLQRTIRRLVTPHVNRLCVPKRAVKATRMQRTAFPMLFRNSQMTRRRPWMIILVSAKPRRVAPLLAIAPKTKTSKSHKSQH